MTIKSKTLHTASTMLRKLAYDGTQLSLSYPVGDDGSAPDPLPDVDLIVYVPPYPRFIKSDELVDKYAYLGLPLAGELTDDGPSGSKNVQPEHFTGNIWLHPRRPFYVVEMTSDGHDGKEWRKASPEERKAIADAINEDILNEDYFDDVAKQYAESRNEH